MERLDDILELLDSVRVQTYKNLETIFVAEGSLKLLDSVKEYVSDKRMRNVRVIFNGGKRGLSEARNLAIGEATGDIIAFADDDDVLAEQWAEEIVKTFTQDKSVIGVTGSVYPRWEDASSNWLPEELYWLISCTRWRRWDEIREVRNVWGVNMAFSREAFDTCGLFPTALGYHRGPMAEDLGFSMMVRNTTKKRIVFNPKVEVHHKVHRYRLSWRFIAERSYWIGQSRRMLKTYYPNLENDLLSTENDLVKRIVAGLLPKSLSSFRKLRMTLIVLFFAGLGYLLPGIRQSWSPSAKSPEV
jgi:glycosyltransferase involved in cell wall biosynthesis